MGCHTWCYAHLPHKADEWAKELVETVKAESEDMVQYINNEMTEDYLQKQADMEIHNNNEWLKYYYEAKEDGDISEYLRYFDNDESKLNDYINSLHTDPSTYTWKEVKQEMLEYNQEIVDKLSNIDDPISYVKEHMNDPMLHSSSLKFGLYLVHDGKMYRDTTHYRGPNFGEGYVTGKPYHDIFRIYDYGAPNCYSLEETLELCKKYNVDWDATYPNNNVKMNHLDLLKEFWETYPDGIIEFG